METKLLSILKNSLPGKRESGGIMFKFHNLSGKKIYGSIVLLLPVILIASCQSRTVSSRSIHYSLYWHQSPYDVEIDTTANSPDFLKKRGMSWGNSVAAVSDKIKNKSGLRKEGFIQSVHLFPEISILSVKRDLPRELDKKKYEEVELFKNGEFHFFDNKLYEIVFTYSVYKSMMKINPADALQMDKNDDPALRGIYHIFDEVKMALQTRYGKGEEKIRWQIDPGKQVFFKAEEEFGKDKFQNDGQCFKECIWTAGDTEIRLVYSVWGYGTIKLYYWNPEMRKNVSRLEQKRKASAAETYF